MGRGFRIDSAVMARRRGESEEEKEFKAMMRRAAEEGEFKAFIHLPADEVPPEFLAAASALRDLRRGVKESVRVLPLLAAGQQDHDALHEDLLMADVWINSGVVLSIQTANYDVLSDALRIHRELSNLVRDLWRDHPEWEESREWIGKCSAWNNTLAFARRLDEDVDRPKPPPGTDHEDLIECDDCSAVVPIREAFFLESLIWEGHPRVKVCFNCVSIHRGG